MIKSLLKQNYTIPQLITKIHEDFGELFSEEEIYEYAYNGHIQLSLMIPKNFYYGHILNIADHSLEKDYAYYSDPDSNEFNLIIGSKLYLSFQDNNYQALDAQYNVIEDLWDIPTTTHDGKKSDLLSALYLFAPDWNNNLYDTIPKIDLISPQKDKYAIAYRAKYRNDLFDLTWSFDDDRPNEAKLVIRKENLDAFIQNMNEALSQPKQKAKPLHTTEKENLLRIIGILLEKGHEIGDIRTFTINKKAELLEASLKERQLKEPKKTTITAIIKNALELIPPEKEQ